MRAAYVDTSCLVAIALGERGHAEMALQLEAFDHLLASNLLEAEFVATLVREGVEAGVDSALARIDWVLPQAPLSDEIARVLASGYVRGADAWHLACALWLQKRLGAVEFLTLDTRQHELARDLGLTR